MSKLSCPYCGNPTTRTIDTRSTYNGRLTLRIRECECGVRWNTIEALYDEKLRDFLQARLQSG